MHLHSHGIENLTWLCKHLLNDIFSPSEGGTVSIFRGISRGRSPREIPRKILTVPTSDGENNILSRIGGMSEKLYVHRVTPRASPCGKSSGMPLGQHSGHTNLVTISCKGIFWIMVIVILRIYFYLIMRTKCHYISFKIFSNVNSVYC